MAFDSIHRSMMMKILKAYDVPPRLLAAINKLHENTRARVITPDVETELFQIIAGVLQGDTLAPYLFAIILDYVMRTNIPGQRGRTWISPTKTIELHCNAKKTEIQTFNHDTPIIVNSRDGTKLKIIENFKYLGSWMKSTQTKTSK